MGTLFAYGQSAGGDLTGLWPNPTLKAPLRPFLWNVNQGAVAAGNCTTSYLIALPGDPPSPPRIIATSPIGSADGYFVSGVRSGLSGYVVVQLCPLRALAPASLSIAGMGQ